MPAADPPPTPDALHGGSVAKDLALLDRFAVPAMAAPGFVTDALGIRTRVEFDPALRPLDGQVAGAPAPGDPRRMIGVAKSVLTASAPGWRALDIAPGWATCLVAGATMARRGGPGPLRLHAVTAAPQGTLAMEDHFRDNALDPGSHALLTAPVVPGRRPAAEALGVPPVIGFTDLLAREPEWDFVHLAAPGEEAILVAGSIAALNDRVRWLLFDTASRKAEGDLLDLLHRQGWRLDHEAPCRFVHAATTDSLAAMTRASGTQLWWNPRRWGAAPRLRPAAAAPTAGFSMPASDDRLRTVVGRRVDGGILLDGDTEGCALFGPYCPMEPGAWRARVSFGPGDCRGHARLDVVTDGTTQRAYMDFAADGLDPASRGVALEFSLAQPVAGLEVRLFVSRGFVGTITALELRPAGL